MIFYFVYIRVDNYNVTAILATNSTYAWLNKAL